MEDVGKHHLVVAVARSMGSGGSYLGRKLAERLGCSYFDREILLEAARRMKRDPEALEALDERHLTFWERTRLGWAQGAPDAPYTPPALNLDDTELQDTQKAIILEAAARGPAVVVGRVGFWILRKEPGLLSVFLHAPLEQRVERVRKIYRLGSLEEAHEMVLQSDRQRSSFVKAVTDRDWLDMRNHHLCLATWRLGTATSLEIIYTAAQEVYRNLVHMDHDLF